MGYSVAGNCKRHMSMKMSWFQLTLLMSVALAAYVTEYPPSIICTGILVSVVLNWIVSTVCAEASELVLGVTLEATQPSPARLVSDPKFDPRYGYVAEAIYDGQTFEVVLPVNVFSTATTRKETTEMAVENSRLKPIDSAKLPKSLVGLYSEDLFAGWGSRIRGPDGQEYLLTAQHVWDTTVTHLCKDGKKVPIGRFAVAAQSYDKNLDFVLVTIPKNVWSVLGIGVARLSLMKRRVVVTVYGGRDSKNTFCSTGAAELLNPFKIEHRASTAEAWSGSPLYYKDTIVGLHLGGRPEVGVNRAFNIFMAFKVIKKFVTVENGDLYPDQSEGPARELDAEEYTNRLEQGIAFEEYDISGIKVRTSDREWTTAEALRLARFTPLRGGKTWFEESDTQESAIQPLNCQRAGSLRGSPPLANLLTTPATDGVTQESSIPAECRSDRSESRVASLEKQVAEISTKMSQLLALSSQNSESSRGLVEAPKQKSDRSSSKPAGLRESKRPPICNWQSLTCNVSTQDPKPEPASAENPGTVKSSSKKSKRSRNRGKSTSKQVPGSPSQSSEQATSK